MFASWHFLFLFSLLLRIFRIIQIRYVNCPCCIEKHLLGTLIRPHVLRLYAAAVRSNGIVMLLLFMRKLTDTSTVFSANVVINVV